MLIRLNFLYWNTEIFRFSRWGLCRSPQFWIWFSVVWQIRGRTAVSEQPDFSDTESHFSKSHSRNYFFPNYNLDIFTFLFVRSRKNSFSSMLQLNSSKITLKIASTEVSFIVESFAFFSQYLGRKVQQSIFVQTYSYGLRTANPISVCISKWADYLRSMYLI